MTYSFRVTDSNRNVLLDPHNQNAVDGTGIQRVKFEHPGITTIDVWIGKVGGQLLKDTVAEVFLRTIKKIKSSSIHLLFT